MSVEETNGTSGDSSLTVVTLFVIVVFGIVGFCTIIPYIYSIDETVTGYVEDVQYFTPERLASQDTIIVFENGNNRDSACGKSFLLPKLYFLVAFNMYRSLSFSHSFIANLASSEIKIILGLSPFACSPLIVIFVGFELNSISCNFIFSASPMRIPELHRVKNNALSFDVPCDNICFSSDFVGALSIV